MKRKYLAGIVMVLSFLSTISYAETVHSLGTLKVFSKDGGIYVNYKDKQYELKQYVESDDAFKYYSLQHIDGTMSDKGLVLIVNSDGNVVKEIANKDIEYCPKIIIYNLNNNDALQDLILFWPSPMSNQTVEVWKNKNNEDFVKVFEKFNTQNVRFLVKDGVPTLAFEKAWSGDGLNDNSPDKNWFFYKWDGKTFK